MMKRRIQFFFLLLISLSGALFLDNVTQGVSCTFPAATPRQILTSTLNLKPKWAVHAITGQELELNRLLAYKNLFILNAGCPRGVVAFEAETGDQKWYLNINAEGLTLSPQAHYLLYSSTNVIGAIDPVLGKPVWQREDSLFIRNGHQMTVSPDNLILIEIIHSKTHFVDEQNGMLTPIPRTYPIGTQWTMGNIVINRAGSTVSAFNLATQTNIWQTTLSKSTSYPWITHANAKITIVRSSVLRTDFTVFDTKTGEKLFDQQDFTIVSNIVIADNKLIALTSNAELLIYDLQSRVVQNELAFSPPQKTTNLLWAPGAIGGSWIAIAGNNLGIYFQDEAIFSVYELGS